jgi:L-ectoine synthase
MIVSQLEKIIGTDRDVAWGNGQSRRFLLERDGMGFTLTDTLVEAGTESLLQYRNHLEACYCIEGEGEVEAGGEVHHISKGTLYAPDQHDEHWLRARTDIRLVCVFLPALKGHESHQIDEADKNGQGSAY